jgi:hypothetical protein
MQVGHSNAVVDRLSCKLCSCFRVGTLADQDVIGAVTGLFLERDNYSVRSLTTILAGGEESKAA